METTNNQNSQMLNNLPSQTPSNLLEAQMLYNNCVHVVVKKYVTEKQHDGSVVKRSNNEPLIKQNQSGNTCYVQLLQFEFNTTNLNMVYTNSRFSIYKGQMMALISLLNSYGKKIEIQDPKNPEQKIPASLQLTTGNGEEYVSHYVLPGRIVVLEYLESQIPDAFVKAFLTFKDTKIDAAKVEKIKDGFKKRKTVASKPFVKLNPETGRYENIFSFKIYDRTGQLQDIIIKDYDEQSNGGFTGTPNILPQQ